MRLTITVVDPSTWRSMDVLLDAEETAPVEPVAEKLVDLFRPTHSSPEPSLTATQNSTGEGELLGSVVTRSLDAPVVSTVPLIYVGGQPVDPSQTLGDSPLCEGVVVSIDDPSGCLLPEPAARVEVRVVGGPSAGRVHRLDAGSASLGRSSRANVIVDDPALPDHALHVAVSSTDAVTVTPYPDAGACLEGTPLTHARRWRPGDQIAVGDSLFELALSERPDAALFPSEDGAGLDYNRPPRVLPPARPTKFRLPAPPSEQERRPLPILMALIPLVMAVAMAVGFGRLYYLAFALLSPVSMIGNHISNRRQGRQSFQHRMEEYERQKEAIEADARQALGDESAARRRDYPDPAAVLLIAVGPRRRLWERRRHNHDYLLLRVGTTSLPSEVELDDPTQQEHKRQVFWRILNAPVAVPIREHGVVGVAGPREHTRGLVRGLVAQSAVLHSPLDLQMYLLGGPAPSEDWEWARWLPHLRPAEAQQDIPLLLGSDTTTVAHRIAELGAIVAARKDAKRKQDDGSGVFKPDILIVLDGARRLRSLPGAIQILTDGPEVGVYAVCLDDEERLLPGECNAVVTWDDDGLRVQQMHADTSRGVRPDCVSPAWCQRLARGLAPVRDVSDDDEDATMPSSSRLLDVLGLEPPTSEAIRAHWALGGRTTEAVLGESIDGPFSIDIRRDGPHGLVAGTTGSGKSELLQTLVASLAVANRPDAMTFVLVDYKGGSAFMQCEHLPHTVGMVTDLDAHLVERALQSLTAELTRREHVLAAAGTKDIEDYTLAVSRNPSLGPMPRLLIIIDEFASLARELPDFVNGLVNIAQRGRSLGIHLVLATQRPSGVVSAAIQANTNLRIALRVTDPSESSDVIDAPDAARIAKTTPGRAYVRLGHASLVPFQTGRVGGGRRGQAPTNPPAPWITPLTWAKLGYPTPIRPKVDQPRDDDEVTDLSVLVEAIQSASAKLEVPAQHSPWLSALPETLLLKDLDAASPPADGELAAVPYAIDDLPTQQARRVVGLDFATFGHLFAAGAPRTGRSQLLRTIAGSIGRVHSCADVHLYGIDCGNGALLPVAELPHCGAVVTRTQTERARRLVTRLLAETERRQELLAEHGYANVDEQRAAASPDQRLAHVVVLLDRWEGFTNTLGEIDGGTLQDNLFQILREGASVGVHMIIAGDRTMLSGRVSTFTEDQIAFRLADRSDFSMVGINPRNLPERIPPGRAFRNESGVETHVAVLTEDKSGQGQAAALQEIAREARERDAGVPRSLRPFRVDVLPRTLTFDAAWEMRDPDVASPLWALVGVGGDELTAYGPDLAQGGMPAFVVAGPSLSGRSTLLLTMARSLLARGTQLIVAAPRPSPLRDLEGQEGVVRVFAGEDIAAEELAEALDALTGPGVVIVDDGELLKKCSAADVFEGLLKTGRDQDRALILGGNAEDVCGGFTGWQIAAKRARRGVLLSPQEITDADLIGARLPRSAFGQTIQPGRALAHLGDNEVQTLVIPNTVPEFAPSAT